MKKKYKLKYKLCFWKDIYLHGESFKGTGNKTKCSRCNGYNKKCLAYVSIDKTRGYVIMDKEYKK